MISPKSPFPTEPSTFHTQLTASSQAKLVAERFISTLSTVESPSSWATSHAFELISSGEREILAAILTPEIVENLQKGHKPEGTSFYIVGQGSRNIVWGHPRYPNIVFKLMDPDAANSQIRTAKKTFEVTREMNNCWIQIPKTSSVNAGKITAYIEERLPLGLDIFQHEEFWARILLHYQSTKSSNLFRTNLETLISQVQILIERVGFCDIIYRNLPEVRIDGTGVCGTDFENVELTPKSKTDGLRRLARMVPVVSQVSNIIESYKKELPHLLVNENVVRNKWSQDFSQPTPEEVCQEFHLSLERKKEKLKALQDAIQIYDERRYVTGDEEILPCDLSDLDEDEKILAQNLLTGIAEELSKQKNCQKRTISLRRRLCVQPGSSINNYASHYTRERFLKVLNILKKQGIVISWTDDYKRRIETGRNHKVAAYTINY